MDQSLSPALRLLSQFWLEELRPDDLDTIRDIPELTESVSGADQVLTGLAVEYQRLFGFNLPPYESVFIDPSAMLMAPATARVQKLYQQAGWSTPPGARTGGPDHLGLELLALAGWLEAGRSDLAERLVVEHLALWSPVFVLTLRRLDPPPFYDILAGLTLDLVLSLLPADPVFPNADPFPDLPPPPQYRGAGDEWPVDESQTEEPELLVALPDEPAQTPNWRKIARKLVTPRTAGLFLTRQDIARLSRTLDLPGVMGERARMLENLLRLADQYDLLPELAEHLSRILIANHTACADLAGEFPAWTPYALAWQQRLAGSKTVLNEIISG